MKNLVEELRWRGMLHDMTPGTEEQLLKEMTAGYVGFDPTASSLHIGNLATLMLLVHLQRAGHKPYALVGGATGMVGDPSGKSEERKFLDEKTLRHNQDCIKQQLSKFLDFNSGDNSAEIVNNYDWFKDIGFLQFLREAGKFLTVNYMMAKDSVKKRLETGISFTEFSYQLLQGYDFYHLYHHNNVRLQMGGSDQWGNITTGTELIRRKAGAGETEDAEAHPKAFALTCPLVTKSDGTKFGKSESGNVWLDPAMTSPYKFYQFWLNVNDADLPRLLRVFSLKSKEEIEELEKNNNSNKNVIKHELGKELTIRVHSEEAFEKAFETTQMLFRGSIEQLQNVEDDVLEDIFSTATLIEIAKADLENVTDIPELLAVTAGGKIFPSKGEARKMIKGGGVRINKVKITEANKLTEFELIKNKYLIVQRGSTNYFVLKLV